MAKSIIMVLDTETCGNFDKGFVYDLGYVICDKKGNVLAENNWLVREIFTSASEMMGAFFAAKFFTHYAQALQDGAIRLTSWAEITEAINRDIDLYQVNMLTAYNLQFDLTVMRNTQKRLGTKSRMLKRRIRKFCLLKFAKQTRLNGPLYKKWAFDNGYVTPTGLAQVKAEIAYRYISGQWDYKEPHTALGDARMEAEMLAACFRSKRKIPFIK
jgi:hypothetical protein